MDFFKKNLRPTFGKILDPTLITILFSPMFRLTYIPPVTFSTA